jgi:ribose 5-phosphate isomerase
MEVNELKRLAAERAVEQVRPGMRLGLGSGTTAYLRGGGGGTAAA